MLKNLNNKYWVFVIFLVIFAIPLRANGAELFFISSSQKPAVDGLFKVDFFINTEEENINAMAGKIVFSPDWLELKEIRDGNSIVNLYVDRPALKSGGKGQIVFSGVTPGGYNGERGLLFSVIFRSLKPGKISINLVDGQALLNDGKGTAAKLSSPVLALSVGAEGSGEQADFSMVDKTPPESFVPEIAQDKNIEGGKWFVVFATQDKESGIDHYEIYEDLGFSIQKLGKMIKKFLYPKSYIPNSWDVAFSPYVLQDQTLRSYVYIKAVDKAGNATIAVVKPKKSPFSYEKLLVYGILLLVLFFGILKPIWRKKGC